MTSGDRPPLNEDMVSLPREIAVYLARLAATNLEREVCTLLELGVHAAALGVVERERAFERWSKWADDNDRGTTPVRPHPL